MEIKRQFNLVAEAYDRNRRRFIPCFDDFYQGTTDFIAANIREPKRILDLGAGTGLLTCYWHQRYPNAAYVLVDVADEMLKIAHKRFGAAGNISYEVRNYQSSLPEGPFDVVVSALSIHHLEDGDKAQLFARIREQLSPGGVFINYDQFCAAQPEMDRWFTTYWEGQLMRSGLTEEDIALWRERQKLDRECSVEQEETMLRECGFQTVQCVYSCQKFSVLAAIK